jgi:hypothetical protein
VNVKKELNKRFFIMSVLAVAVLMIVTNGCRVRVTPSVEMPAVRTPSLDLERYRRLWDEFRQFQAAQFPGEALVTLEKICRKARANHDVGQYIKAVIHKLKIIYRTKDDSFENVLRLLEYEIKRSTFPVDRVFHSMLAEQYRVYFRQHRKELLNRAVNPEPYDRGKAKTWNARHVEELTARHYIASLENAAELKQVDVRRFGPVLVRGGKEGDLRPTLFDFLAHRAVDFFMDGEKGLTLPDNVFLFDDPLYFSTGPEFTALTLQAPSSFSYHYYGLCYLQELEAYHLERENRAERLDVVLKRLKYVHRYSAPAGRGERYAAALETLAGQYNQPSLAADIYYALVSHYYEWGKRYRPGENEGSPAKWGWKKAVQTCRRALELLKEPCHRGYFLGMLEDIRSRRLSIQVENAVVPHQPFKILVEYRNVPVMNVVLTKRKAPLRTMLSGVPVPDSYIKGLLKEGEWEMKLPDDGDFHKHRVEVPVHGLEPGEYLLAAYYDANFDNIPETVSHRFIKVARLSYISRTRKNGDWEFYLLDRETGHPLSPEKTKVLAWHRDYDSGGAPAVSFPLIDPDGRILISRPRDITRGQAWFEFSHGGFFLSPPDRHEFRRYRYYRSIRTYFFTDRSIYRPGQRVYFKGIIVDISGRDEGKSKPVPNHRTTVRLFDVNGQEVSALNLVSNEFGAISGSFQLPLGRVNGKMKILNRSGQVSIQVEEYKRPAFEVMFEPLEKSYRLNDIVTMKGKAVAYAGYAVDRAKVVYRVVRGMTYDSGAESDYGFMPWEEFDLGDDDGAVMMAGGETRTRKDGSFEFTFKALPDPSIPKGQKPVYGFMVYADVTDLNGETRGAYEAVTIGTVPFYLETGVARSIDKDPGQYTFSIVGKDRDQVFVPVSGSVSVYRLETPDRVLRSRSWRRPDKFMIDKTAHRKMFPYDIYDNEHRVEQWKKRKKVSGLTFDTARSRRVKLEGLNKWDTGKYVITVRARDRYGHEVREDSYLTLYSGTGRRMPYTMQSWFHVPQKQLTPGETADVYIGSSEKNVHVIFELERGGKIIHTRCLILNNELVKLPVPVKEEHQGNLGIHVTLVRHNRLITHDHLITVPWTSKKLDISFRTFRGVLTPGQREQWQLVIKGPGGENAAAEMVAALYDASLDEIRFHQWYFSPHLSHIPYREWRPDYYFKTDTSYIEDLLPGQDECSFYNKMYDRIYWFGFEPQRSPLYTELDDFGIEGGVAGAVMMERKQPLELEGEEEFSFGQREERRTSPDARPSPPVQRLRKNFNETAFFYPHLKSDANGEVVISFTMPDALTRWKLMALAHTRLLRYGFISKELVTRKDLMVVPSPPRFFRAGDSLVFTAKVVNLSDHELDGTAELKLLNAETLEPMDARFLHRGTQKTFKTQKGKSALVSWNIKIPHGLDAVMYRLTARAGNFSDGEERVAPILKNRVLVTESLPLPVRGGQTKAFTFKKLVNTGQAGSDSGSSTLSHHRLTLEFTSNPVWYAVQALPYMMEFPHECMEQVFNRYYADTVAAHIVKSRPAIQRVFKQWQAAAGRTGAVNPSMSNLEKNKELKALLLEETPWVLDGRDETERKQRLAMLFDPDRVAREAGLALRKLKERQLPSGAWSWFGSKKENRYITQYIVSGLAHLRALKVMDPMNDKKTREMLKKALVYLDRQLLKDHRELLETKKKKNKKEEKDLDYIQIHALYARSYFKDVAVEEEAGEALAYYRRRVKESWRWFSGNPYMLGMMALTMNRLDDRGSAAAILEYLKREAYQSEEMGMYWETGRAYYWFEAPIETQALLIEAFAEVLEDDKSVEAMKTWLLKRKQTSRWHSTRATAEACYALLLTGRDWLSASEPPHITLGRREPVTVRPGEQGGSGETIEAEAGTGYFKTAWTGERVQPDMGYVTVKNVNKGPAWGALYWQYFENMDRITPAKSPLRITRRLWVERNETVGLKPAPLDGSMGLKVGDRVVVRLEITSDRYMEYIHVKDRRASAFEPEDVLSGYKWGDGIWYYQVTRDASSHFFIDELPAGTYRLEYTLRVTHEGDFSAGFASVQCMYAPEMAAHSGGKRLSILK